MLKNKWLIFLAAALALSVLPVVLAQAQVADISWTQPFRISDRNFPSSEAALVEDDFGLVHLFWAEVLPDDRSILQYSRFDGEVWSVPNSIHISPSTYLIDSITVFVDQDDYLNVYWTEGVLQKNIRYTRAPIAAALSSQAWSDALQIKIVAKGISAAVDSQGVHHLIFSRVEVSGRGLYYIHSSDHALTWSPPVWLDPDIPVALVPDNVTLKLDQHDSLHVVWNYSSLVLSTDFFNWIRYARLQVGENKWTYVTIDRVNAIDLANDYQLAAASPVMTVSGDQVLVVWAGGSLHYRHFRYSTDSGQSWSKSARFMGDLNGQAGDGLAVDGAGRIHYFTQIRFPMGIYHAVWDGATWSAPTLIYFIRYSGDKATNATIVEAHAVHPAIRAGNELVVSFADEPSHPTRGVYLMSTVLSDLEAAPALPLPPNPLLATAIPTPTATATADPAGYPAPSATGPAVTATPAAPLTENDTDGLVNTNSYQSLFLAMVLSLVVVAAIIVYRIVGRR